jgi:hypothetical protein
MTHSVRSRVAPSPGEADEILFVLDRNEAGWHLLEAKIGQQCEKPPEHVIDGARQPILRGVVRLKEDRGNAGLNVSELNAEMTVENAIVSANWR